MRYENWLLLFLLTLGEQNFLILFSIVPCFYCVQIAFHCTRIICKIMIFTQTTFASASPFVLQQNINMNITHDK